MKKALSILLLILVACPGYLFAQMNTMAAGSNNKKSGKAALSYPAAMRDSKVDNYFGTKVPVPYQWMEKLNSPAVKKWVQKENDLTYSYLDKIPLRNWIYNKYKSLYNYERVGVPDMKAGKLFYSKNSGLQNQSVIYEQSGMGAKPKMVLDPNKLSPDGSVDLASYVVSPNGKYMAYALSQGGSDWRELHVMNLSTGKILNDEIKWVKFSGISWTKDSKGFFYSRFPAPPKGQMISQRVRNQKLYYHMVGSAQSADKLIYERNDLPKWIIEGDVSESGRYLLIYMVHATSRNMLYYANLGQPERPDLSAKIKPLYTKNDASYAPIGTEGSTVFLQTTLDAPKGKIVAAKFADPAPSHWKTIVPEGEGVIQGASMADGKIVVRTMNVAKNQVHIYSTKGELDATLPLPGIGTVRSISARNDSQDLYYSFTSFLYPTTVYHYNVATKKQSVFFKPKVDFNPDDFVTKQVFYKSKDGTMVPMFITARKDLKMDGNNPTVLYGYGGFDITITPSYNPMFPVWLGMGGVYAVPNLRGGGVYGQKWHQAGMQNHKQNVFNDFISAAEYLIHEKFTKPSRLAIQGYSNGGLLVGATITQRPDLFGAAYAGAGVMDMLRYQKFSGGEYWTSEYGSSDNPKAFKWLYAYSPLHNIKKGTCYPPTIITTADHDDRVVPSHSYKFAAKMQYDQGCTNPVLIRVETETSHGYMPTDKRIAQTTDVWTFIAHNLGIKEPAN